MHGHAKQKQKYQFVRKFDVYLHAKNLVYPSLVSRDIKP